MSGGQTAKARKIADLKWIRGVTDHMVSDFPADKGTFQPWPGENHVVWSLGHLTTTYVWLTGALGGKAHELPAGFHEAFKPGNPSTSEPGKYPSFAEVKKHFDSSFSSFLNTVEGLSEEQLGAPLKESIGKFATNGWEVLDRAGWHEGWHAGQISSVRRALGLPAKI